MYRKCIDWNDKNVHVNVQGARKNYQKNLKLSLDASQEIFEKKLEKVNGHLAT